MQLSVVGKPSGADGPSVCLAEGPWRGFSGEGRVSLEKEQREGGRQGLSETVSPLARHIKPAALPAPRRNAVWEASPWLDRFI